jgi:hypothetical protein
VAPGELESSAVAQLALPYPVAAGSVRVKQQAPQERFSLAVMALRPPSAVVAVVAVVACRTVTPPLILALAAVVALAHRVASPVRAVVQGPMPTASSSRLYLLIPTPLGRLERPASLDQAVAQAASAAPDESSSRNTDYG